MKTRILVVTVLLAGSLASLGQDTVPPRYQSIFGDSNTVWYIFYNDGLNSGTETWQALPNDTVSIDGNNYNVIRYMDELTAGVTLYGDFGLEEEYLRESPDHSKLYFKQKWGGNLSPEVLIMDLNLNIGDTLDTHYWSELLMIDRLYGNIIPSIRIDTIYYLDGRKILCTNYKKHYGYMEDERLLFIEGIGPDFGPFYAGCEGGMSLTCYYRDGVPIYHGDSYRVLGVDSCCIIGHLGDGITASYQNNIATHVYPNPTRNALNIEFKTQSTYIITIASSTGSVIYKKVFHGDKMHVDIQNYPKGIYFLTVTDSCNNTKTTKIIKL